MHPAKCLIERWLKDSYIAECILVDEHQKIIACNMDTQNEEVRKLHKTFL